MPSGAYYATATDVNGAISCSKQADIVPPPYNLNTTNITSNAAQLNWTNFYCADTTYALQFRMQGTNEWTEKQSTGITNSYVLSDLLPSTTYVWRVASEKRKNGIKATGKYSDSVIFTTASAMADNLKATNINSTQLSTSPNPAKNSFKILFTSTRNNKVNATLYNVNGKAVWRSGLVNANTLNNKNVTAIRFAKGVYYLKLINEQGELIGSTKVIVAN